MVVSREGAYYVRRAGRMTCTRPAALNYTNPRAHWPKVSVAWGQTSMSIWALKGATHCNRATRSNYLTPTLLALCEARSSSCSLSPGHTRSCDLCALGLRIVKAAGLVQASCLLNFPRTPMVFRPLVRRKCCSRYGTKGRAHLGVALRSSAVIALRHFTRTPYD